MKSKQQKRKTFLGFTLIEAVVGIAIFGVLSLGMIQIYTMLTRTVKATRQRTILTNLANQKLEVGRNLPYSQIGTINGNPTGVLPDFADPQISAIEGVNYHIYYEVTYVDDDADGTILLGTDPAPNDYKQLKMFVLNTTTNLTTTFVTNISPRGLEGLTNAGALLIKVFDSVGQPIAGANVAIQNSSLGINLSRQTDSAGNLVEVGLPASVNGYNISATKSEFSTDSTYPLTVANPNPTKPDATITNGSVTQVSFSIDLVSNLAVRTLNQSCNGQSNVNVNIRGGKLIGTTPDVFKFDNSYASVGGLIDLTDIEWDNYTPALLSGQGLMVYGTSPVQNINILPNTSQTFSLIVGPQTANSLLVLVKDSATGTPLEGASVNLTNGGGDNFNAVTGGSVKTQFDWSGGPGQADFTNPIQYFSDDGFIDVGTLPSGVRLLNSGGYVSGGMLESSTFDTGTSNTQYTTMTWQPTSQDPATQLRFQIATNNDNSTWSFRGPDGTPATYYTTPGSTISAIHNNDRYIRYRAYLGTTNASVTPVLTGVQMNYVSGCFTPGQAMFANVAGGGNYTLNVSLTGYQNYSVSSLNVVNNQTIEVLLSP